MKSFKEYLTEQEKIKVQEELNESIISVAANIVGYSAAGLLLAFGGSLVVKGYATLGSKVVTGVRKFWNKIFKRGEKTKDVTATISKIRTDPIVKEEVDKAKEERNKYADRLSEVFKAIEEKDVDKAKEELKLSGVKLDPEVNRVIISEIVDIFGEPPLHYGNTGNESYLFIKSLLGIRTAQTIAALVRESLKKNGSLLLDEPEKKEEVSSENE